MSLVFFLVKKLVGRIVCGLCQGNPSISPSMRPSKNPSMLPMNPNFDKEIRSETDVIPFEVKLRLPINEMHVCVIFIGC